MQSQSLYSVDNIVSISDLNKCHNFLFLALSDKLDHSDHCASLSSTSLLIKKDIQEQTLLKSKLKVTFF